MLNIAEELKTIYKNDVFPLCEEMAEKDLTLYFPELDLTIGLDKIVEDSFELSERICSDQDITLGACEAAQFKIKVAGINQDLSGETMVVTQIINGLYTMPLGTYTVSSCEKEADTIFKEITAYDGVIKSDVDVSAWYNGLTFPISARDMRESLLTYLGISYEDQDLINDDVMLEKTIEPSALVGRNVLMRLCELSGGFGHITRENKFKVIQLSSMGLYPSETLYPAEDLFPAESGELLTAGYRNINYEEYIVEPITKLQIRQDDEDEGAVAGSGDNTYVITGNFLLYGRTDLEAIADNILLQVSNKFYRPHETQLIGLPYLEVGDTLTIITDTDAIETFIFTRTLTGIQALQDEYTASGNRKRDNKVGLSTQVEQLKGKTLKIQKSVEGVQMSVTDLDLQLTSEMNFLAGQIILKVDASGNVAAVELGADPSEGTSIKLKADNIIWEGLVTANSRFKILLDGSIEATNAKLNGSFVSIGSEYTTTISNGEIIAEWAQLDVLNIETALQAGFYIQLNSGTGTINAVNVNCSKINGYTPITSQNIGSQTVAVAVDANKAATANYATNAGSATYATSAGSAGVATDASYAYMIVDPNGVTGARISINDNFIPTSAGMYIGSSGAYWAGAYLGSGPVVVSDENKKHDISDIDDRYVNFAKQIRPKLGKYNDGTSGRTHAFFIAQQIEQAMIDNGITDMEFAGLIKAPIYAMRRQDEEGNEMDEYDTSSEIIGYDYGLRYDEFIPLLFAMINELLKNG